MVRNVNISLHCKFRSGAWRHRADFQDSLMTFENAIIYKDTETDIDYFFSRLQWTMEFLEMTMTYL